MSVTKKGYILKDKENEKREDSRQVKLTFYKLENTWENGN